MEQRRLRGEEAKLERERERAMWMERDMSLRVQVLLKENNEKDQIVKSLRALVEQDKHARERRRRMSASGLFAAPLRPSFVSSKQSNFEGVGAQGLVTEHLVPFKSIGELEQRNRELVAMVRQLCGELEQGGKEEGDGEKEETHVMLNVWHRRRFGRVALEDSEDDEGGKKKVRKRETKKLQKLFDEKKKELGELKVFLFRNIELSVFFLCHQDAQRKQLLLIRAVIGQRDLCRAMLLHYAGDRGGAGRGAPAGADVDEVLKKISESVMVLPSSSSPSAAGLSALHPTIDDFNLSLSNVNEEREKFISCLICFSIDCFLALRLFVHLVMQMRLFRNRLPSTSQCKLAMIICSLITAS
jgi:hypothetical protein